MKYTMEIYYRNMLKYGEILQDDQRKVNEFGINGSILKYLEKMKTGTTSKFMDGSKIHFDYFWPIIEQSSGH